MASPPLRWSFHLDREHPLVTDPVVSAPSFTEGVEKLRVEFGLGKASTISYRIYRSGVATPVRVGTLGARRPGRVRDLVWNGNLAPHHLAPGGTYWMAIDAVDQAGNRTEVRTPALTVLSKRILISLRKEALWAYDGDRLLYHTLVSNGGPDTPTLPGIFHVEGKYTGFVFHSPWPKGSQYWYPPSPTSYALLYNANGGYFIHDAPWRSNFGPGSNSVAGTPGGNYTGTHGCTNVPLAIMGQIFDWADVGTLIKVVP
jgi:hypothetical protein